MVVESLTVTPTIHDDPRFTLTPHNFPCFNMSYMYRFMHIAHCTGHKNLLTFALHVFFFYLLFFFPYILHIVLLAIEYRPPRCAAHHTQNCAHCNNHNASNSGHGAYVARLQLRVLSHLRLEGSCPFTNDTYQFNV